MANNDPWSDAKRLWLRTLWADGKSANMIAEELHVTKSAVTGQVRRMHLTPRGSPLHNGPTAYKGGGPDRGRPGGEHRAPTNTLPPLPSLQNLEETS